MKSILDAFKQILSWPARLSVAARATCCLVVGLVTLLTIVWVWYLFSPRHIPWAAYMSWSRAALLCGFIVGVAGVAYWTFRTWLSEEAVDRSIHSAWKSGLRELRNCGLPIDEIPIHLVLGAGSGDDAVGFLQASGEYRLFQQPKGAASFSFSANPHRICLNAGGVGHLALVRTAMAKELARWSPDADSHLPERAESMEGDEPEEYPDVARLDQTLQDIGLEAADSEPDVPAAGSGSTGGSVATVPGRLRTAVAARAIAKPMTLLNDPLEVQTTPLCSFEELSSADQKLHQLANLLRAGRRPLCPINRILVVVPISVLLGAGHRVAEMQRAIRRDLSTLDETLQVNSPVSVLIGGFEDHPGFSELIRRVGPDVVRQQPLGKAMEVGSAPTPTQMEALATQACGQVEDVIYALLRKDTTLSNPSNTALYRLLCDIRTGLRTSLRDLLVGAFASPDPAGGAAHSVAGCYFFASGPQPQRTGFLEPVFRLQDFAQEELEWFPPAVERDTWHRQLSRAGWIGAAGLLVVWLGLIGTWLSR